jgi:hypothetical protein
MHQIASSGLVDPADLSEIKGYTAREKEAIAGTSGAYILYLIDEASAVGDDIFEAIAGNRAGGNAWMILISNPTRAEGEFYESHHDKSKSYKTIHVSSRESPNITGECESLWGGPMPGLAVQEWIDEMEEEWGADSPLTKIRIDGLFSVAEEAKVFPLALIAEMQARWIADDDAEARLFVGVDPAGDGDGGDESAFVPRRGLFVGRIRAKGGMSPEAHVAEVLDVIAEHRRPCDTTLTPIVVLDYEGPTGSRVYAAMRDHADRNPRDFEIARVRASDKAIRQPLIYDRMRDELWAVARDWARAGGAVPEYGKLTKDLHAPEFAQNIAGRLKVTPKRDLRKTLGRSPDVGDAFVLSCWEPLRLRMTDVAAARQAPPQAAIYDEAQEAVAALNPYGEIGDPYGR